MRLTKYLVTILTLTALLSGCGARGPGLETLEAEPLFQRGVEAMLDEDWTDAVAAFERFGLVFADHPRAAEARYQLGRSLMGQREFITAALEFNRLASDFPAGPWADDARYMVCMAYNELSPKVDLDQQYTRTAIDHCESLILFYPDSELVPQARERVTVLTNRLAEKEFNTADHYFRKQAYDSSIIYFEAAVRGFPQTPWAPRALMRMHEAYVILKYDDEAREVRDRLLKDYPDSPEAKRLAGPPTAPGLPNI